MFYMTTSTCQIASVKAGIMDRCKRGVNSCLHGNSPLRGTWRSLQGKKLDELSLQLVRNIPYFVPCMLYW